MVKPDYFDVIFSCSPSMAKLDHFDVIDRCTLLGRQDQTIVAELEGSLMRNKNPFPYLMLVALEGGSLLRALLFMLIYPLACILSYVVGKETKIKVMVFFAFAGQRMRDIELVARAVLPKFFSEDVRNSSWRVFSSCKRRYIVTSNPRILVEPFAITCLGADKVIGSEIQVTKNGYATGFILPNPGVMVGFRRRNALVKEFGTNVPNLALGLDVVENHPFMSFCKEAYNVPRTHTTTVQPERLVTRIIFHDGRLVHKPTPMVAFIIFLWLPIGFLLALFRILTALLVPPKYVPIFYKLIGVKLSIRGVRPNPVEKGILFVCTHRTLVDPIMVSAACGLQVTGLTYSISKVSEILSPIKTFPLSRNREKDSKSIKTLLKQNNVCICPEGTTCREPFLLRFSALFAELSDNIIPVATSIKLSMFHGTTARGWKGLDPFFVFMNPFPSYEVTFLEKLPLEFSIKGGRSAVEVANYVQRVLADCLSFECTQFTRKDKYNMLAGSDGSVPLRMGWKPI